VEKHIQSGGHTGFAAATRFLDNRREFNKKAAKPSQLTET
jgi:hypothetical protein